MRASVLRWAVVAALLCALAWSFAPRPSPVPSQVPAAANWELVGLSPAGGDPVAELKRRNPWGVVVPTAAKPELPKQWRIIGVVAQPADPFVLIRFDQQPAQSLKPGDELPGGNKILVIAEDHLCVLVDGKKRKLPIYQ